MFESQLVKSIEVYIDDMVVKSKVVSKHVGDLENIFEVLRKHKLRLNTSKCFSWCEVRQVSRVHGNSPGN